MFSFDLAEVVYNTSLGSELSLLNVKTEYNKLYAFSVFLGSLAPDPILELVLAESMYR